MAEVELKEEKKFNKDKIEIIVKKGADGFGICKGAESFEEEEFLRDFLDVPKPKKLLTSEDIKRELEDRQQTDI